MIWLVESFFSVQGEGLRVGTPSIFIRFGGCNLNCIGFGCSEISPIDNTKVQGCDSLIAVNKTHFSHNWNKINSKDELLSIIDNLIPDYPVDIVFTGGEPLLNIHDEVLYETVQTLLKNNHHITFETNATISVDFEKFPAYKNVQFSMSVKLANSGEDEKSRINQSTIKSICENTKDSYFKFTLDKNYLEKYGNNEIYKITKGYKSIPIFCMPMGSNVETLALNDKDIIEFCKKYNYRYGDRLHIRVYHQRHGV